MLHIFNLSFVGTSILTDLRSLASWTCPSTVWYFKRNEINHGSGAQNRSPSSGWSNKACSVGHPRTVFTKNMKECQNLNICVHWLLMIMIVEMGFIRNCEIKLCFQTHWTKNIYTTIIKPIVLCGCETWTMTEQLKSSLEAVEWKIEMLMAQWKVRMLGESELTMNCRLCIENQISAIKVRWLEWAGQVVRMCDNKTVKKAFSGKPAWRRKAGRPKLRCLDCIENDPKSMDVKRWSKKQKTDMYGL